MLKKLKGYWPPIKLRIVWALCSIFPVDRKKVTVSSFYGRGYGDNGKYIVNKLLESEKYLKIVWLVKNKDEKKALPQGVQACIAGDWKTAYHLLTSKIWVDNCRKFFIQFKKKNQFYIQTWHGFALKRIEKDANDKLSKHYVKSAKRDSKNTDCIISCSRFMTNLYKNAFWYDGQVLELGAPRNDILLQPDAQVKTKVYDFFNIDKNKRVILYAPTFRADGNMGVYSIDYERIMAACRKRFGDDFIFITRLHPNIMAKSEKLEWSDKIINGSYYPDMQELMVAAAIIITDYSSVMFDFALTFKPCFQFAMDIDTYKGDRNFYFELDKLPFTVSKNNNELEKNIINFDESRYREKLVDFYQKVGMVLDGCASEKCARLIIEKCYRSK